ncbi:helix-turn-helix domain-containing protein [Rhodobacteraceae bacterium HSP-20]|uniref:Helix-turn-helix domain-containing protein n=1 Tax=Paragemmobacter amnigenus TaxID=2852097 RepID=A0ABS6J564_9RHOB|nr:XRE family transcriptional regulator [Rhodobacter amnigenus]MBU9698009.1 helix-turn-helix domain-containing protein [Rhodobacter amnigenus]MBV4389236.1 helix-turn-helix domain-containing protein [Rhodobacter amnigenus]
MTGRTPFSELRARMSPASQARATAKSGLLEQEMALAELRRAMKLSQEEIAAALNINQASVARMEKRTDMYIGTLRRFVQAMGGELDIIARFPDRQIRIDQFRDLAAPEG